MQQTVNSRGTSAPESETPSRGTISKSLRAMAVLVGLAIPVLETGCRWLPNGRDAGPRGRHVKPHGGEAAPHPSAPGRSGGLLEAPQAMPPSPLPEAQPRPSVPESQPRPFVPELTAADIRRIRECENAKGIALQQGVESGAYLSKDGRVSSFAKMYEMKMVTGGTDPSWTATVSDDNVPRTLDVFQYERWMNESAADLRKQGIRGVVIRMNGKVIDGETGRGSGVSVPPFDPAHTTNFRGGTQREMSSLSDLSQNERNHFERIFGAGVTWADPR